MSFIKFLLPVIVAGLIPGPGGSLRSQCPTAPVIHTGEATYYTFADGSGNCSFDPTPDDLMVGAMNDFDYGDSWVCGECVSLTGPDGTIRIRIVDRCPECQPGDIDLSPLAFSLIAELSRGRVPISWEVVPCDVTGPIEYHFKEGSNQWWTAVQIRNHRYAVAGLEVLDGGVYTPVPRLRYNYFVETAGLGPGPYSFRVTDVNGAVLADSGIPHMENASVPGSGQFPLCPDTPTDVAGGNPPAGYSLSQNFPNPWNPTTVVRFELPRGVPVLLTVYNGLGQEVARPVDGYRHAGPHEVVLDGEGLPAGVYYYRIVAGGFRDTKRLVLMK